MVFGRGSGQKAEKIEKQLTSRDIVAIFLAKRELRQEPANKLI
jgi:hypothetical protein